RLEQVLVNLLNNAAKYTPQGGHVWLTVECEENEAILRVRDNGIGIPADMLPIVFDLFVQADRSLDRSQGGLGIGLTLVRDLIDMHGGSVQAQSAGPGQGSEFVVRLPTLPVATHLGPQPETTSPNKLSVPKRRILVVDDNVDAAQSLA